MTANKPTLLVVNIHFAPHSFGGATVVAENMAVELSDHYGWQVVVITAHQNNLAARYSVTRYTTGNVDVFSITVPEEGALSYEERYANSNVSLVVEKIIDRLNVDVAHIHSIQNMGIGIIELLHSRDIAIVTTVHDCWWLCERMFMIDVKGKYCHQNQIDMDVCRFCVNDFNKAVSRKQRLFAALEKSDTLLFPSQFHKELYVANGFREEKCLVNKNGVQLPKIIDGDVASTEKRRARDKVISFGFVGGPGDIKGAPLIKRAFDDLPHSNYQLLLVDGAQNRGLSWAKSFNWKIPGELIIVPPYNRDNMDDFFSSIDVLLFPSQWKESFGLTVREAISRGVWVIVTDAGGIVEDCVEGVNSNIVPMDGDYIPLRDSIKAILDAGHAPALQDRTVVSIEQQARELNEVLSYYSPVSSE
jgi:glycosyltransferase involved in cell wall biosynthesis